MAPTKARRPVPDELIQRCRQGDRDAHRELFALTLEDVRRILVRLVGPVADFEDLLQEAYLALFAALGSFRGESAFSTFLFGVCFRVAKKRARAWLRWGRLKERAAQEPVSGSGPLPDQEFERAQQAVAVQRALDRLSFKLRTVLVLYELEGLSGAQIAGWLGIPEKTVWTRLHSARKAFRRVYRWPPNPSIRDAAPS